MSLLDELNEPQQKVVRHTDGPLLVLAGAGSGKTRCITYRVAYLITEKLIEPNRILLVTFTNKAAGEMRERVDKLLSSTSRTSSTSSTGILSGTFHSLCAKILRKEGRALGLSPGYVIYDEDDQEETVKEAMGKVGVGVKEVKPRSILNAISEAKNELIGATEYPQYARGQWQETVAKVYLVYQQLLREADAVDFDDLLMKTVQLFQRFPDTLARYQHQWQYVLVDEYQDTNQAQFVLTKLAAGKWRNLCCVGDFSQSIYRWRGADFRNLERLKEAFPDLVVYRLEQNYRSTQTILDAAHGVINHNTSHPILALWTEQGRGQRVGLYEALNERDEGQFIVNQVNQLISELSTKGNFRDFAVLYRTNAQSRAIEEALVQAGIPYVLVGGTRFYQRKEIKDCLAYLRVLINPKDSASRKRIEKLGKGRLGKFLEFSQNYQSSISQQPQLTTVELLDQVLTAVGYLEQFDEDDEEDLVRLENIKELRSVAEEFPDSNLFLENVALVEATDTNMTRPQPDKSGSYGGQVTLMTLHAAKGLEFKVVFLVGMEEGLFPHSRSILSKDDLEEERRLAYVGITRAKEKLYITYALRRLYFGVRTSNLISRFVGEIPEQLLESVEARRFDQV